MRGRGLPGGGPTRAVAGALAAVLLAGPLGACAAVEGSAYGSAPTAPTAAATPAPTAAPTARPGSAMALLGTLAVKGRGPRTGYQRELFGPSWADIDGNGCDTRNDILARDLTGETVWPGTRGCVVLTGTLADPYTGRSLLFRKADAAAVQIDHVVSLSDAWQKGASRWTAGKRLAFANDPLNLLAVDGSTNASKADADAASWLPPHRPGRCVMAARQVAVKTRYEVWVTATERDALARVLAACSTQVVPTGDAPT